MPLTEQADQAVLQRLAARPGLLDQSSALALQMESNYECLFGATN